MSEIKTFKTVLTFKEHSVIILIQTLNYMKLLNLYRWRVPYEAKIFAEWPGQQIMPGYLLQLKVIRTGGEQVPEFMQKSTPIVFRL